MKKILHNLALLDLMRFCEENNIPTNGYNAEGTHCVKAGRGFTYNLVSDATKLPIASVTFHKSSVPTHILFQR